MESDFPKSPSHRMHLKPMITGRPGTGTSIVVQISGNIEVSPGLGFTATLKVWLICCINEVQPTEVNLCFPAASFNLWFSKCTCK